MADELAVLQSKKTIAELEKIEEKTKTLVTEFKNLYTEVNNLSKGFGSGKPKEFASQLAELEKKTKDIAKANKELAEIEKQTNALQISDLKVQQEKNKLIQQEEKAKQEALRTSAQHSKALEAELKNEIALNKAIYESEKANKAAADVKIKNAKASLELARTEVERAKAEKTIQSALKESAEAERKMVIAESQRQKNLTEIERTKQAVINTELKEIALKQRLESLDKKEQARLAASISLYKKVEAGLNSLRNRYNELAIKKQFGVELTDKETRRMAGLEKAMIKYDTALKAVDASGGKYNRNVGNYASGFNAMNNSIAQLTREMPAFANSVQTGFMALSNNIPNFADAISQARKENSALLADGKKGIPVWKQIAQGFFSWNTALSVGIVLLTVYGDEIVEWVQSLYKAKKVLTETEAAQQSFSEALKNGEYTKAIEDVKSMAENLKLAKDGFIDKARVLKEYNEGLGQVMGTASSFNEMEDILIKKTPAYLQAMRYRAAASVAIQKASETRAASSMADYQQDSDFYGFGDKVRNFISGLTWNKQEQAMIDKKLKENAAKERQIVKKQKDQEAKAWDKVYDDEMKKAAEIAKKGNLNVTNLFLGNTDKDNQKKEKAKPDLSKDQRSFLDLLEAERDKELRIELSKQNQGLINEADYQKRRMEIMRKYAKGIQDYLKGANAKQIKIEEAVLLKAEEETKKAYKEIYDYEKEALDARYKLQEEYAKNALETISNDEFISETERVNRQIKTYDEMIGNAERYYDDLIAKAIETNQEIINIEAERDAAILNIQTKQQGEGAKLPKAIKTDTAYYQQIEDAYKSAADSEARRLIIENSRLDSETKSYMLSKLGYEQTLENLKIEKSRLELRQAELIIKQASLNITKAESDELAKVTENIAKINEQTAQTNQSILGLDAERFKQLFAPVTDFLKQSLSDLGFNNLVSKFDEMYDKILKGTFNWEDATVAAASAVADAFTMMVQSNLANQLASYDEQIKVSQENTDLEIGFINSRLEALNAIEAKTAEQITERNRLEDEARVLREQQQQREKQIEIQKAKAQQRAAAQQALINGLLAATMALATQPPPGSYAMAAVSAAMGIAMAALIMSKNPVPQYFVGRENGKQEWAWTQEKGREIITDKKGNIKSFGSDKGAEMTWLEAGDKVKTASETRKFLEGLKTPEMDAQFFHKINHKPMPTYILPTQNDNSEKTADLVGKQFDRVMKKYDKEHIFEKDGKTYSQKGGQFPVLLGRAKRQRTTININSSRKDVRN